MVSNQGQFRSVVRAAARDQREVAGPVFGVVHGGYHAKHADDSPAPHAALSQAPARTIDRTTRGSRAVALLCALSLIVLGVGWELVWARTGHGTLVAKVLPLVVALPGLSRHRMYTYRWLSLAVWLYVAEGVVRIADAPPVRLLASLELALAIALFAACATQVRWRLALAKRAGAEDAGAGAAR
jgi:uncharacterized membrane protein